MTRKTIVGISEQDLLREGMKPRPETWEDGLRADPSPGCFEWWYFDAHFDDGSTAVIVFYTKSILNRKSELMPCVSLTITRPDGEKLMRFPIYAPGEFSAAEDTCDTRIGPNWVKGDLQNYALHVDAGDLGADLQMQAIVPAWRPGVGKNYYDEQHESYFGWLAALPYGTISGSLKYDGQTHTVQGTVYHDHNWGNIGLENVMSHWYWGRAQVGEYTLIFVEMTAAKSFGSQKLPVFLLARGEEILIEDGRGLQMQAHDFVRHSGGREYPQRVEFDWRGPAGAVHLGISDLQMIEATTLLASLPPWKRRLAHLVGANPYYFRFNAALSLDLALGDTQFTEQGRTLYEIMLLK